MSDMEFRVDLNQNVKFRVTWKGVMILSKYHAEIWEKVNGIGNLTFTDGYATLKLGEFIQAFGSYTPAEMEELICGELIFFDEEGT
ncbi:hypothetical protein BJP48_30935 [Paenibacillus odorifer]|nr:hypothetical protein BJP48_30935 [Paenibacillus odorifer]